MAQSITEKHRPHHIYELPNESEERLERLFNQLDANSDGRIDVNDLTAGLQRLNIPFKPGDAEHIIKKADITQSNDLTFAEFVHYLQEHEKQLLLVFRALDRNKDGRVDEHELVESFKQLGVHISPEEANRLLRRVMYMTDIGMDKDGTLNISFDEWRDYLMFHPTANLRDIIVYWRHATMRQICNALRPKEKVEPVVITTAFLAMQNLDIGDDLAVPDDFSAEELETGKWWRHLVAGGFAGMVSRTCTAPLDRIKVFLQVHGLKHFKTLGECFRYMMKEGGVRSLWRGNGINVLKIAPESALKFAAYEQAKKILVASRGGLEREVSTQERFVAGSFAGGFSQSAIYPLEVLKTRLALRKTGQYKSIFDAAVKIYRQEGYRSFYRGYVPNILGILPYAGIDLCVYETLKNMYISRHQQETGSPSILVIIGCGALSSSCGQISSYPLALVRTRLQAQVITPGVIHATPITMTGLFRHILETDGPMGLYRGIAPNFMKVAPAVSISYVVYEKCREALGVSMS